MQPMMIEDRFASEMTRIMRAIEQGADPANLVTPIHATPLAFVAHGEPNARRVMEERGRSLSERGYYTIGSLAVLPVMGPIWQGGSSILTRLFGGTTMGAIASAADLIAADESVTRVLLHLDTPGGTAHNAEAHRALGTLAATKPMTALASVMACSAGYDMACYAEEIVATATAMVGSVGSRYGVMYDESESAIMEGVRAIPLTTAKHKLTGAFGLPIDDEQVKMYERMLWYYGDRIIGHVSESRGIDRQTLIDMQGACYVGTQGVEVGLVDRVVETAGELLEELADGRAQSSNRRSSTQSSSGAVTPSLRHSVTQSLSQEPAMAETKNGAGQAGTAPTASAASAGSESSTTPTTPAASATVAPVAAQASAQAASTEPVGLERLEAIAASLEEGERAGFVLSALKGKMTETAAMAAVTSKLSERVQTLSRALTEANAEVANLKTLGSHGVGVEGAAVRGVDAGTTGASATGSDLGIAACQSYDEAVAMVSTARGISLGNASKLVNADPHGKVLRQSKLAGKK